jgi:RNase P/RNase MRP subunit POP5
MSLINAIWGSINKLYGEYGASQTNLSLINYDSENKQAIIRTNLSTLNIVRSSLVAINSIAGSSVSLHVLSISGTIKALKKSIKK